jgi:6-phosphofructokinase 1
MGRDAGWIALHSAVAGGAEVCLIPEIPYKIDAVLERIHGRIQGGRGFVIIVIAEGAKPMGGDAVSTASSEIGYAHKHLGGAASRLKRELQDAGCEEDVRVSILGHLQRGGSPSAYDRILATQFGVKAFEMVLDKDYGKMVSYKHPNIVSVPIRDVIANPNNVKLDDQLLKTARGLGMVMGD